jgi:6-pyruvoyltetrahydropterin/6-carboxytetrahydropterin synthase
MYTVAVKREFVAQHFLIGGDWGAENEKHSHHYVVELQLEGATLDEHGYLVDIVEIEGHLDEIADYYRDKTLTRIICQTLAERIQVNNLTALTVVVWENDIAWASYRHSW